MKCTEICEMLPDLAAGMSAPAAAIAGSVNDHLRACTECSAKLDEFRKTMALLDEWVAPEPSPYFDTRLKARLREEAAKQPQGWFAWARRPVLAVSLGLVLVAGATVIMRHDAARPAPNTLANATTTPGTAVGDLQDLDKNHDMLSDSDPDSAASLLDDLQVQNDVNSNP